MNSRFISIINACLLISVIHSNAQDTLKHELDEVTISALRTEKNLLESGRSITVITSGDLEKKQYSSLAEILSEQSGIYITGNGQTPGSNQSIFLRGANSNQTAIFINGVRISDVSTVNNTIDLSEISVHDIERIEIIKGSHSTLFGSAAIGGVVNITTKKNRKDGVNAEAAFSAGQFGSGTSSINPYLSAGYQFKNGISLHAMTEYTKVEGLDATIDTIQDPQLKKFRDKDNWDKINSAVTLGYDGNNIESQISYRFNESNTDIDKSAFNDDDNYKLNFKRSTISARIKKKLGRFTNIVANGGISLNQRYAINDSSHVSGTQDYDHQFTEDKYKGTMSNADIYAERKFDKWRIILGASRISESMESENYIYAAYYSDPAWPPFIYENKTQTDKPFPSSSIHSIYTQIEIDGRIISEKFDKLRIPGGIRYDAHDIFNEHISYELSPNYSLTKNSLIYLSYSTGYNAPSLYQMYSTLSYAPWDGSPANGFTLGNKNLNPEKSGSFEAGFKQKFARGGSLQVSVYTRDTENSIEYVYLWNGNVAVAELGKDFSRDDFRGDRYINTGTLTVYGAELNIMIPMAKNLKLLSGISIMDGKMSYLASDDILRDYEGNHIQLYNNGLFLDKEKQDYDKLIRRPSTARLGFSFSGIKNMQIDVSAQYTGDRDDVYYDTQIQPQGALNTVAVEKYTLLNARINYQFNKYLTFALHGENLLDTRYSEIRGFTTRGRALFIKAIFKYS